MTARVNEAISIVVASQKVERMLLDWAKRLTEEERISVRNHFSECSDQRALDIWADAMDIADAKG